MDGIKRCKCANFHQPFRPDPRNAWHQRYCQADACRAASKAASQQGSSKYRVTVAGGAAR
jgi:hypothetical protein